MCSSISEVIRAGKLRPTQIKEEDRDYYLERRYPAFGNLMPRDVASRAAKERCDAGYGVGAGQAVYLDFADAINRLGRDVVEARYGNLFQMYEKIVDDNPYETPMMIYPALHYSMGGLWVDYELMTNIPGLFAIGEANFSDHGANRLGASALMQGLADGYFVLLYTIQNYLVRHNKNTENDHSVPIKDPDVVSIPMSMHIGAPCTPTGDGPAALPAGTGLTRDGPRRRSRSTC